MDSIIEQVQKYLIAEYRKNFPEFKFFIDAEIALLNPVTDDDVRIFIYYEKSRVASDVAAIDALIDEHKKEIEYARETLDDPNAFSEAKSEANRDISYANNKVLILSQEKMKFLRTINTLDSYASQEQLLPPATLESIALEKEQIKCLIAKIDAMIADYQEDLELSKKIRDNRNTSVVDRTEASNDIVYDTVKIYKLNAEKEKLIKRLKGLGFDDEKRGR